MRAEKESVVQEIRENLDKSDFTILVNCRGLNVSQLDELRSRLDRSSNRLEFFKNTFLKVALRDAGLEGLLEKCSGPTAMVTGEGDMAQICRAVLDYSKDKELPEFKGGSMGSAVLSADDIVQIAKLPSRETLLGQAVGTIAAPMTQFVGVLQQKVLTLLYVLKAVEEKKGGE